MERSMKFGRKVPMPSMVQIKHGLKMMAATDALVGAVREKNFTPEELSQLITELTEKYGIPPDRARILSSRFGAEQRLAPLAS
ncbi:hypothetical protein [Methylobacterium nigriterrae]|uniref:hypothetical protein n=1 Tax=Methylobacterium nigriterrae TaxID=3127512 RepID=UPI0030139A14